VREHHPHDPGENRSAIRTILATVGPMGHDSEEIVEAGYDQIATQYLDWINGVEDDPRLRYLNEVLPRLPDRPHSLDLGCGAGVPCTALLAERGEAVGLDVSAAQLELASSNVPKARFVKSSMTTVAFPSATFDLVAAFYSIPHLPRAQHAAVLTRITEWLRPGGYLLASLGHKDHDVVHDMLGVPMVSSSYGAATNRHLLLDTGLTILTDETVTWHGGHVTYQWVIACKPSTAV
jgi:trans-aconitate methyltransferase